MDQFFNAAIPIFTAITFVILVIGLIALFRGGRFNSNWSNKLMRLRVLSQFIVIMLVAIAGWYFAHR